MPSPLCHFEIMTEDVQKSQAFYGGLLGWSFDDNSMPGYTLVNTGSEPTGGMMAKPPEAPCAALNVYFHVEDLEAAVAKAQELGGSVIVPPTPIPNVGGFAMVADPEGIVVGLFKPAQ